MVNLRKVEMLGIATFLRKNREKIAKREGDYKLLRLAYKALFGHWAENGGDK